MLVLCILFAFCMFNFAFFNNMVKIKNNVACGFFTSAKAMAVIEKNSGRLLYNKNENERLPMASLTKIITAIYVISQNQDLDEKHKIPENAVGIEGTSIGLKAGEHLSIRELLYGLMLRSGNDSAVALAMITSGSEENFVNNVNDWLIDLGFKDTQIKNPHGLNSDGHYTTALELAKITALALNNSIFQEIVSTKEKEISNELNTKTSRNLKNKNRFLKDCEYADGVKTGFTKKAGRCFVGSATKNNMQVICVLLNCVPMFEECESLINLAFEEYHLETLVKENDLIGSVKIRQTDENKIVVKMNKEFLYPLKNGEKDEVVVYFKPKTNLIAPINIGDELAEVEISFKNQLIFSDKIYSIKYIESNNMNSKIEKIIQKM